MNAIRTASSVVPKATFNGLRSHLNDRLEEVRFLGEYVNLFVYGKSGTRYEIAPVAIVFPCVFHRHLLKSSLDSRSWSDPWTGESSDEDLDTTHDPFSE
jgi:hypothetical protein